MILSLVLITISGALAQQWTSSSIFPNGTVVQACLGDNVTFPWMFNVTSSQTMLVAEWLRISEAGQEMVLAHSYRKRFLQDDPTARRVEFVPNAGLRLPELALTDTGHYNVHLHLWESSETYSQTAFLQVWEAPVTIDGNLYVFLQPIGDYPAADGQWQMQLSCGKFLSLGHPPVSVVWKTPSSAIVKSTSYINNTFTLVLSKPVQEGAYSCLLDTASPATKCVNERSSLHRVATVQVNGLNTRLSLLEGGLESLREETVNLSGPLNNLHKTVGEIETKTKNIEAGVNILNAKTENITSEMHFFRASNEHLTAEVDGVQKENEYLKALVSTLENDIRNMTHKLDNVTHKLDNMTHKLESLTKVESLTIDKKALQTNNERIAESCLDVRRYSKQSGVHVLVLNAFTMINVFCDQSTDNGGWTIIQRRQDGSVEFYRKWEQYVKGFGELTGEFWIGLENIHLMTENQNYKLRVDLTDFNGSSIYAQYQTFYIGGAKDNYQLHIAGYTGTAGDSLIGHNGNQFSTYDRDNDKIAGNCARDHLGGWWYNNCYSSNLNGRYKDNGTIGYDGLTWRSWKNDFRSFKRAEMKIKLAY